MLSLIMVVNQMKKKTKEEGQSVVEFLLILPLLVGLVMLLIKVNTAIQLSIVNQQYSRAHIHWLAFNSAFFPQIGHRKVNFVPKGYNRMVIGVSDNKAGSSETDTYEPEASTQSVVRSGKAPQRDGSSKEELNSRARVRIRNTISLCTQSNVIASGGGGTSEMSSKNLINAGEGPRANIFRYCRGPLDE
jgi:hypothetical protein